MAPKSLNTSKLELHESEIAKPQPLRIIKRSKTISGSSSSGDFVYRGRGASGSSDQRKGSPSLGADRSLTVYKVRKGRGSILNGSIEGEMDVNSGSAISDLLTLNSDLQDDSDITPKARKLVPRTVSAGAFLKAEYHERRLDPDAGRYSIRTPSHEINLPDLDFLDQHHTLYPNRNTSPNVPERRFSKSKNFLLRAIGGRNAGLPRPIRRTDSTMSKNTLIRRFSQGRNRSSGSYDSSYEDSVLCSDIGCSFGPASADIADISVKSRMSSFDEQPSSSSVSVLMPSSPARDLVLCPQIMVTPEISSVDGGICTIWVAIEVTGVLRKAEGYGDSNHEVGRCPSKSMNTQLIDLICYGKLHSMRIDLHPGQGCTVLEIIGNLHESKTIRASETQLILAKVRLGKIEYSPEMENSSEELIADLQNQLGDTLSSYLTVRLTYKHSAFPNHKGPTGSSDGMNAHTTRIETEATATIKRRNPESAWSPRTSQTMNAPLEINPLIKLIEKHFTSDKVREALRKLADDRSTVSTVRRFGNIAGGSSEETVKANPKSGGVADRIDSTVPLSLLDSNPEHSSDGTHLPIGTVGSFTGSSHKTTSSEQPSDEIDPARKIWSEMRLTSRGGRHRIGRTSISADHYFAMEEDNSPTRASSGENSVSTASSSKTEGLQVSVGGIDQERNRIMEVALRNKRSVGTETLRSIAPSVVRSVGKPRGGTVSGLGLGAGRTWGWGPPWW